jgi:hypothetical protein
MNQTDKADGSATVQFIAAFPMFMFLTMLLLSLGTIGYYHDLIQGELNASVSQLGAYNVSSSYGYNGAYSSGSNTIGSCANITNEEAARVSQMETVLQQITQPIFNNSLYGNPQLAASDGVCSVTTAGMSGGTVVLNVTNGTANQLSGFYPQVNNNGPLAFSVVFTAQMSTPILTTATFNASAIIPFQTYHCYYPQGSATDPSC